MLYVTDFCRDENVIVPERVHRNRELVHIMSDALNYMDYTDLVEAAVCYRKERVKFIQNELIGHVNDLIWFARERHIQERCPQQHVPWDSDDEIIRGGFWTVMHLVRRNC